LWIIFHRGSAFLSCGWYDNLEEVYRKLEPDLIIMHYYLNIVKNVGTTILFERIGETWPCLKRSPLPVLVMSLTDG
jgi:hypothetical protein